MVQAGVAVMFRRRVPTWNETRNGVEQGGTERMRRAFFGGGFAVSLPSAAWGVGGVCL